MRLNKINIEVYEEILKDLYLFIKINPDSLKWHFDYTFLSMSDDTLKYDNPALYQTMFEYAKVQGVIDVQTETRKHFNPLPDLPDPYQLFGGEYTHYRIKVNKARLDEEMVEVENSLYDGNHTGTIAEMTLNGNELTINSDYGKIAVHTFRNDSIPREFINYILNSKPDELVKMTELRKHSIDTSDTLSEMLRKSNINGTIKQYFFPKSTANTVIAKPKIKINRSDWNTITSSLTK